MSEVFNILDNRIKELAVSRFKVDTSQIMPRVHPSLLDEIKLDVKEKIVIISCEHRDKNGRILNPQNQPRKLSIPRYIAVDESLGEILGLYYGDGTKGDLSCTEFSNSYPELIEIWINYLNSLNIDNSNLIFKIKISENVKSKYEITEDEIKDYWVRNLDISKHNLKLYWIKSNHKPSNYLAKNGTFTIIYNDSMFSIFFNALIENILGFLVMNENFRIGFVRGLIAAEGNINLRKNGSLSLVRIAGNNTRRKIYSVILWRFFNLLARNDDSSNQIYIGNYHNLQKIRGLNLHSLHPLKREKFENGYKLLINNLNKKHDNDAMLNNKNLLAILKFIYEKQTVTYGDIVKSSNLSQTRVDQFLSGYKHGKKYAYNGALQMGLLRKTKKGRFVFYSLTESGIKNLSGKNERI